MRVEQLLRRSAERWGSRIAVAAGRGRHSYAELDAKSDRLAATLAGALQPGDRVAIHAEDSFPAIVAAFGILKAGMTVAAIPPSFPEDKLADWLVAERVTGIVTEARLARRVGGALDAARAVRLVVLAGGDRSGMGSACLAYEDVVTGLGKPRIAERTEAGEAAVFASADDDADVFTHAEITEAAALGAPHPDATIVAGAPLGTHDGFHQMVRTLAAGATLVVEAHRYGRRNERLRAYTTGASELRDLAG